MSPGAMASNPVRVSQLMDSATPLTWQESVALVRGIAAVRGCSPAVTPSGTFEEFGVQENGEVTAVGASPPLSVSELALLLARLLPATPRVAPGDIGAGVRPERPPAGLYFIIARALALVDAPSFATVEDFSAALARFERARPALVLREAWHRYAASAQSTSVAIEPGDPAAAVNAMVRIGPSAEGEAAGQRAEESRNASFPARDRRRTRMPSDVLRRMLREEDRRNFMELQSRAAAATKARPQRQTGPDPQMLRRFIREADERTYALMQEKAARAGTFRPLRTSRRAGYHAAFALLPLLVAVAVFAVIGRQRLQPQTVTPPASVHFVADTNVTPVAAALPVAPTTKPTTLMTAATEAETDAEPPEPRAQGGQRSATEVLTQPAKPKAAVGTIGTAKRPVAKPRGRVPRFFAAIYHRLGSLVRRDSTQPATQ